MTTVRLADMYGGPVFIRAEAVTGVCAHGTGAVQVSAGGSSWLVGGTVEEVQAIIGNAQMPVGEVMLQRLMETRAQVIKESEGKPARMEWIDGGHRALSMLATRLGLVLPD